MLYLCYSIICYIYVIALYVIFMLMLYLCYSIICYIYAHDFHKKKNSLNNLLQIIEF